MHSYRRWIAAGMVTVMAVCLSAFGWNWKSTQKTGSTSQNTEYTSQNKKYTPQQMQENGMDKLKTAQSLHASLEMELEIKIFGFPMEAKASMDMVSFQSPYKLKTDVNLDLGLLGETQALNYACQKDDFYLLYTKNKKGWNVEETTASELYKYDGQRMMQTFLEQIEELTEQGTEKLQGRSTYKYTGIIRWEGLQKILLDTGLVDHLATVMQGSVLKSVGNVLGQQEQIKALMKKAEDLEVTLWIDEQTGYPLQCSMDVTEMLSDAFGKLVESSSDNTGTKKWSGFKLTGAEIVIQCGEYNQAQEFTMPIK